MSRMVKLLGVFGDDLTVVNCARVSFSRSREEIGPGDDGLISFLAREGHWSPFAHPQLRFRFRMPIAIAAQWHKHQVGLTTNSVSRRYVSTKPEMFVPQSFRSSSKDRKQGSGGDLPGSLGNTMIEMYRQVSAQALNAYESLVENGVCPEQARFILPQGVYTEFVQTGSLEAYARIVRQRTHPHAQAEIREYAEDVLKALRRHFPVCSRHLFPTVVGGSKKRKP